MKFSIEKNILTLENKQAERFSKESRYLKCLNYMEFFNTEQNCIPQELEKRVEAVHLKTFVYIFHYKIYSNLKLNCQYTLEDINF